MNEQTKKPLPEPPSDRRWHRANEFSNEDLNGGYRPLMVGETKCRDDETNWLYNRWCPMLTPGCTPVEDDMPAYRTRRPLPNNPTELQP